MFRSTYTIVADVNLMNMLIYQNSEHDTSNKGNTFYR